MEGYAAQIEHSENACVAEFVLQRKADDVKRVERSKRFKRIERQFLLSQQSFKVRTWAKRAFTG